MSLSAAMQEDFGACEQVMMMRDYARIEKQAERDQSQISAEDWKFLELVETMLADG